MTNNQIFIGNWSATLQVFDIPIPEPFQAFKMHDVKLKAGVRTMCILEGKTWGFADVLVCGENDGWIEIVRTDSMEVRISKKFEKMGHIYQV